MDKKTRNIKFALLTLIPLVIAVFLFGIRMNSFILLPKRFRIPMWICLYVVAGLLAVLSVWIKKGRSVVMSVINIIISACLVLGVVYIPKVENQLRSIFDHGSRTQEAVYNVYAFTTEYKNEHSEIMGVTSHPVTSEALEDYADDTFIVQTAVDQSNQNEALNDIRTALDKEISLLETEDVLSAVAAFYEGEGELLVLNEIYVDSVTDISSYAEFLTDTVVVYSFKKEIIVETPEPEEVDEGPKDITNTPFVMYVAGSDTRYDYLSLYGRTDVDIIASVDAANKQVLIVSIPRDAYVHNPALGNGLDKLTHLGNDGIYNTMKGVSDYFGIDIDSYALVNFASFKRIVDALGGIEIDNPYAFSTVGSNGKGVPMSTGVYGGEYYFQEGPIQLDGNMALSYCRERKSLADGDYARNEHQVIVLKAIIEKMTSAAIISHYGDVMEALQGQFLTNVSSDDIYALLRDQVGSEGKWNIITYHLGGTGDMRGTASMGWSRNLYVVHLFDSQVYFIADQVNKMMNHEIIEQQELPQAEDTTYIPN